jgi:hypothetical protein
MKEKEMFAKKVPKHAIQKGAHHLVANPIGFATSQREMIQEAMIEPMDIFFIMKNKFFYSKKKQAAFVWCCCLLFWS